MEVEMEDDNTAVEFTFTAVEVDLDYEYEAARFFDFTRVESIDEALQAEMWFDSVDSYPPSPFAVRLLARESENANVPSTSKDFSNANQTDSLSVEYSAMALSNTDGDVVNEGVPSHLKSYGVQAIMNQQPISSIPKDSTRNANIKDKTKSSWKPSFPRTSTLMKPTASQLAKQNQDRLLESYRFQKLGNNPAGVEGQAAKRQKLEGGHLCKVTDTKQQANFVHKEPKREGTADENVSHGRLRITVPRPPDLATAQRAQRIRQKGYTGSEHVSSRGQGFRARPLNRKIFEAPSLLHKKRSTPQLPEFQEFHLKTTERAEQTTATVPSTSACGNNPKASQRPSFAFSSRESKGPHVVGAPKQEDCETYHKFKALPLNKKIFASKGDLGVFRSSKRETTVAMAFNFQTDKRALQAPPVDLFNKLSLASESSSQLNKPRPRPRSIFTKGSKENRVCSFQQQSEVSFKHLALKMGSKQVQFDSVTEGTTPLSTSSRNLGIR